MAKTNLALQINVLIKRKKLTQKQAAELLDIDQSKYLLFLPGNFQGFP